MTCIPNFGYWTTKIIVSIKLEFPRESLAVGRKELKPLSKTKEELFLGDRFTTCPPTLLGRLGAETVMDWGLQLIWIA